MAPDLGGWIHNFTVTDTQTHKAGYTLYKITSVVFPRSLPQALTQIVVWRRFHDVKRLHRDLKKRLKSLQLPGYLPEPIDCSFFKRFDKDVIQKRKEYILHLLDYAAQNPVLYKCHAFAQFFNETTPSNKIQTLVHKAVRGLNINFEILQDQVDFACKEYPDKKISTASDKQVFIEEQQQAEKKENEARTVPVEFGLGENNRNEEEEDEDESLKDEYTSNVKQHPKHFLTPMPSIESDDSDYIYEAALEFSQAVQAEANLEYTEAHDRYKKGVDILLYGSKDDNNEERKFIAKAKISKYLARAEDIHERFLRNSHRTYTSSPKNSFQLSIDVSGNTASDSSGLYLERPWNHMAKYKVNNVLNNKVLHVTCITEPLKPSYVMKGIEKPSSNSPTQTVFLPQHVPYMVDLFAFFQSDQKIFLLVQLASGGKLIDYIYSKSKKLHRFNQTDTNEILFNTSNAYSTLEVNDLVKNSKLLLQSVSNTLEAVKNLESPSKASVKSPRKVNDFLCKIPEDQVKLWSQQLLIVIHALHEKSVILSDLNMDNLLLNENGQLLLTYFYQNEGVSSDSCIHKTLSPKALDKHFVAPERPLTFRSDWWSYGVILYELFLGLPFKAAHPGQIDLYGFVQYPENANISDAAKDLLEKLLQQMPEQRLDYERIKQHPYFEGTDWNAVKQNGFNTFIKKS